MKRRGRECHCSWGIPPFRRKRGANTCSIAALRRLVLEKHRFLLHLDCCFSRHPELLHHAKKGRNTPIQENASRKAETDEREEERHKPVHHGHLRVAACRELLLVPR